MENFDFPVTAEELGRRAGATVVGDGSILVNRLAPLKSADKGSLTFLSDRKFRTFLNRLTDVVMFTREEFVRPELPITYLVVPHPQAAFSRVARVFKRDFCWQGISDRAEIHPDVTLASDVNVGPFAVISRGARIGRGTTIAPFVYVGADVEIGEYCEVYPRATILDRVRIGSRVKILAGAVIGSDGFGFFQADSSGKLTEMAQIGTVIVEDDVRIGANSTIDRATLGETRIGSGTKIDDQVHVGHNVDVGDDCVLCGQAGIAGSAVLENNVMLGGQAGVGDGVRIGSGARVGAQSGSTSNLKGGETYFLTPSLPMEQTVKVVKYMRKLPEIYERIRRLEEQVSKE